MKGRRIDRVRRTGRATKAAQVAAAQKAYEALLAEFEKVER